MGISRRPAAMNLFFLITAIVLVGSFILSPPSATADPKPYLMLDNRHHKVPPAKVGDYVTHDFVFTNTGAYALKVSRVATSCRCTVAHYDREVPPGGSGRVTLAVRIEPGWAGRNVTQTAVMTTNDPGAKQTRLSLEIPVEKSK